MMHALAAVRVFRVTCKCAKLTCSCAKDWMLDDGKAKHEQPLWVLIVNDLGVVMGAAGGGGSEGHWSGWVDVLAGGLPRPSSAHELATPWVY